MISPRAGILFDLDGTLVDTIPLILASFDHALTQVVGETRPEPVIRSWIGRRLGEVFEDEYPDHARELERVYIEWNLAQAARLIRRYPGIDALVRDLNEAQARFGVVTSKRLTTAEDALRLNDLKGRIELLATMESTSQHKPDPAPLLHGAARLSTPVERCVYVGDAVVDIRAAQAAGMPSIAVTWGAGARDDLVAAGPDHVIDDVAALHAVLLG